MGSNSDVRDRAVVENSIIHNPANSDGNFSHSKHGLVAGERGVQRMTKVLLHILVGKSGTCKDKQMPNSQSVSSVRKKNN